MVLIWQAIAEILDQGVYWVPLGLFEILSQLYSYYS